jgi:hypothetical protein
MSARVHLKKKSLVVILKRLDAETNWLMVNRQRARARVCVCVCGKGPVSEWVPFRPIAVGPLLFLNRRPVSKHVKILGKKTKTKIYCASEGQHQLNRPTEFVVRELRALKAVRTFRQYNVVMGPMELGTNNHCAGEAQQQFSRQAVSSVSVCTRNWWWARK